MSSLVGAFIVSYIQQAALSRQNTKDRPPFYLYLDEFQNYTTDNIAAILAESRKYGLSLTMAHQYIKQVPIDIKEAIFNTCGNMVSFRVGTDDAKHVADQLLIGTNNTVMEENTPKVVDPQTYLATLENRIYCYRRRGSYPAYHAQTPNLADPEETPQFIAARKNLIAESYKRYGRPKSPITGQTSHEQPKPGSTSSRTTNNAPAFEPTDD